MLLDCAATPAHARADRLDFDRPVARRRRAWLPGVPLQQAAGGSAAFAWVAEALASPCRVTCTTARHGAAMARGLHALASDGDGANGLTATAQALRGRGYLDQWRSVEDIDGVIDAVVAHGPVVVAGAWRESMDLTRPSGLLDVSGPVIGCHAWLVHGYHPAMRIHGEGWGVRHEVLRIRHSAGPDWGVGGSALIRVTDMQALLSEAVVAVHLRHHQLPTGRREAVAA